MPHTTPLISVIIPTYNRAQWLSAAVRSAQEAGTNVEVVVVDDASTDETPELCKSFDGVRVVRLEQNAFLGVARNTGIAASSGEYLAFLDDDDRRLPGSLDAQFSVLQKDPDAAFIYGPILVGDSDSCAPTGEIREAPYAGDIFWHLLRGNFVYGNSVLVRRSCLEECGLFDASLRGLEDWDMWIRLAERYRVLAFKHPVAIYRMPSRGSDQMSNNHLEMCRTSARVLSKALNLQRAQAAAASVRRTIRRNIHDYLSYSLLHEALVAASEWQFRKAVVHALQAVRFHPLQVVRPRNWARLPRRVLLLSKN